MRNRPSTDRPSPFALLLLGRPILIDAIVKAINAVMSML